MLLMYELCLDNKLEHTGVGHDDNPPGRGSGRYGWGTGKNPNQSHGKVDFLDEYRRLKKMGLSEKEIAKMLLGEDASTTQLRAKVSIANEERRQLNVETAKSLYFGECNQNASEVARRMGVSEGTVRNLLDPIKSERVDKYQSTANMLKQKIEERGGIIDVGKDSEIYMGITETTKKTAIAMLEEQGYKKYWVKVKQLGTGHETTVMVLAAPDVTYQQAANLSEQNIKPIVDFSPDGGKTWWTPEYPASLDRDRVLIRYGDEGGSDKDGTIEIRPGVQDLSLGDANYAQVRIAVGEDKYMKGMAFYSDNVPAGYDVVYNVNKKSGTPDAKVFKDFKRKEVQITDTSIMTSEELKKFKDGKPVYREGTEIDRDNPFGALIKAGGQYHFKDGNGKDQLSPINKLREEGEWDKWSRTIASQMLAKQPLKLINQQLDLTVSTKRVQLEEIKSITNPVLRKQMLENFAGKADSNASDLSAVGFKNQAYQVLLPLTNIKDNEVYAPNFKDGDIVALIRYPHGGTFEIPILKVNNKNPEGKMVLGNSKDAIGINKNVADKLSGADFDGDTAITIPVRSNRLKIEATDSLKELVGFDPKEGYKLPDSAPNITNREKQNQMGRVTNLITDMTVGGASLSDIAKATKHSMVVIDSEKHHLDYKKSAIDNDIEALKKKYQGTNSKGQGKGASTILSLANSTVRINKRYEVTARWKMTPEEQKRYDNGERIWRESDSDVYTVTNKNGTTSEKHRQMEVTRMETVSDATELVRDKSNEKEMAYARFANTMKAMANEARKEARAITPTPISKASKQTYAEEVKSIQSKVLKLRENNPKERTAQIMANAMVAERLKETPSIDKEHRQRVEQQCLQRARSLVGAGKEKPTLTDREWEAIQANAIPSTTLDYLFRNMNQEELTKRAMPKDKSKGLSAAQLAHAQAMKSSGMYTNAEIAEYLGVSASYVSQMLSK